jgi:hypothetical protein
VILATSWLGTVPSWLTFAGIALAVFVFRGSSPGQALEIQQRANGVLNDRVKQLEDDGKHDRETINILSAKTDVSLAIIPLLDWCKSHERLAEARADEILDAIKKGA